jgi:hypothetical protein
MAPATCQDLPFRLTVHIRAVLVSQVRDAMLGLCLMVRLVAALAALVFRKELAKEAELLVLRHENAVLRRHAGRIRYARRPGMVHRANAADTPPALGWGLSRDAGDAAGLAPQAGNEKVGHEQTAQPRPPARHTQHRPPCRQPGERESAVRLPPDRRRADQARRDDRAVHRL